MGEVADSLAGKTPEERREIKARALRRLLDAAEERTFTRGAFAVTVVTADVVAIKGVWLLDVRVVVTRNGKPLAIDGHLRFVNPPILVPTGEMDADGNPLFVENLRGALRTIVGDEIERQVRALR